MYGCLICYLFCDILLIFASHYYCCFRLVFLSTRLLISKYRPHLFSIVEVMFHALHILIVLVAFSCD